MSEKQSKEAYAERCVCRHPRFKHTGKAGLHENGCELCMCQVYRAAIQPSDTRETKPEKLG